MNNKVLILDDEESILTILKIMMEREGYEVYVETSALQALELMKQHNALSDPNSYFHLIITDVVMPKMNGYEFAIKVLEKVPDQPILFISGFNTSKDLMTLVEQHDHLAYQSKPFGFDDIKGKIQEIIELS